MTAINLGEIRAWIEAAKPTDKTNDREQPVYTDEALLAEDRLVTALLNGGALALIEVAEAARDVTATWHDPSLPCQHPLCEALEPFQTPEGGRMT